MSQPGKQQKEATETFEKLTCVQFSKATDSKDAAFRLDTSPQTSGRILGTAREDLLPIRLLRNILPTFPMLPFLHYILP